MASSSSYRPSITHRRRRRTFGVTRPNRRRSWRLLNSSEWIKFNGSKSEFSASSYRSASSGNVSFDRAGAPATSLPRINGEIFTFVSKFAPFMLRILNYGNANHRQHENRQTLCFIYFFANWIFPLEAHDETSLGILRVKPEVFHLRFSSSFYLHYPTELFSIASPPSPQSIPCENCWTHEIRVWLTSQAKRTKRRLSTEIEYLSMTVAGAVGIVSAPTLKGFGSVRTAKSELRMKRQKANGENFPKSS